jgi:hypothetical protein
MTRLKLGLSATTAGVLVALASLLVLTGMVLAVSGASAALSTGTADSTGAATVNLSMTAPSGSGVGNWAFDVGYTAADYTGAPTCTTSQGDCTVNPAGAPGIVRFAGFASGLTGTTAVGSINFVTNKTSGCSNLTLAIAAAAGSAFQDANGADFDAPTFTAGSVCAAATAAPTAAPTTAGASASPTKTPAALPQTGGPAGDSSFQLGWLLAIAGLVVVAGGAWTLARREDS